MALISSAYRRLGPEPAARKRERRELSTFAEKAARLRAQSRPRLVRPDAPVVIDMATFLQSRPTVEPHAVILDSPAVVSFDKREVIAREF